MSNEQNVHNSLLLQLTSIKSVQFLLFGKKERTQRNE